MVENTRPVVGIHPEAILPEVIHQAVTLQKATTVEAIPLKHKKKAHQKHHLE